MYFNVTVSPARKFIVDISPRAGSSAGGTGVLITLAGAGLLSDPSSPAALPSIMFGSAPVFASVVVSDLDATILSVKTPPVPVAKVVHVVVAQETSTAYAYNSLDASAQCVSSVCEVDASTGGSLTLRATGLQDAGSIPLACTIDGSNQTVPVSSSTPAGPDSRDLVVKIPGMAEEPTQALTSAILSCMSPVHQIFTEVFYRSPPRVRVAQFSGDGSRLDVIMDQRTDAIGSVTCDKLFLPADVYAFGTSSTCWWDASGSTLQVLLGSEASVVPGSTITVLAGVVRSLNGVSVGNRRQQVSVQGPHLVLPPR